MPDGTLISTLSILTDLFSKERMKIDLIDEGERASTWRI